MATTFDEPPAEVGEELLHDEEYAADVVARLTSVVTEVLALRERVPNMAGWSDGNPVPSDGMVLLRDDDELDKDGAKCPTWVTCQRSRVV
jgi:hypothetical protein